MMSITKTLLLLSVYVQIVYYFERKLSQFPKKNFLSLIYKFPSTERINQQNLAETKKLRTWEVTASLARRIMLKGQSNTIFCTRFFSSIGSFWSHKRWSIAVSISFAFSSKYWTFKTTPRCFGNRGVAQKFLG